MNHLTATSLLAENTFDPVRLAAVYLGEQPGISAEFLLDAPWEKQYRLLIRGDVQIGWICGLLYANLADQPEPPLEILAAPVMADPRYRGRPDYFSDLVVHRDSPFYSFADLQGSSWVYNEAGSYSGHHLLCYHLVQRDLTLNYFDQVLESGSHLNSLNMVAGGLADFTLVDSTLLDYVSARQPDLAQKLRVIDVLGPSPIPPWVISLHLPKELREHIRQLLLTMHHDPGGQAKLGASCIAYFTAAVDSDYQMFREVARSTTSFLA